jgi:hypothetical protein
VAAYASRNAADSATEIIVVNWNTSAVALSFQVTDLAGASPAAATYRLPATAMAAVEIKDSGTSTAWVYGEDERRASVGPQVIAQGTAPAPAPDGGAPGKGAGRAVGMNCPGADGGFVCPSNVVGDPSITVNGAAHATAPLLTFGAPGDGGASKVVWGSYAYAAPGQPTPTATLAPDGKGLHIMTTFVAPLTAAMDYAGFGLYYSGTACLDATAYTGLSFDFSGQLGGCQLGLGISFSDDQSTKNDAMRGSCPPTAANCYGPSADVTAKAMAVDGGASTTIKVPFTSLGGGMPSATLDPSTILTVQWQLVGPTGAGDGGVLCAADFTVENVKFY